MKKLISSFAVIGVLALSLIGGPAMASPAPSPTPTPSPTGAKDICIQVYPYPASCQTQTPTEAPLKKVTPISPTVKFDKCGAGGTVVPPVIEGIEYSAVLGSAGMHHISWSATALPGYVLSDSAGNPLPAPVQYYLATLAPACPTESATPTPTVTPIPIPSSTPTVAVAPPAPKPPVSGVTSPEPTDQLAYTGLDTQTLLIGGVLTALGLLAIFLSKRRYV